jgi:hypothetical protein
MLRLNDLVAEIVHQAKQINEKFIMIYFKNTKMGIIDNQFTDNQIKQMIK